MDWVEAEGKTVEVAVQAALDELGVESRDDVQIEILQEPTKGFLGIGGQDAIVKVIPRPKRKSRRRRGRGKKGQRQDGAARSGGGGAQGGTRDGQRSQQARKDKPKSGPNGGKSGRSKAGRGGDGGRQRGKQPAAPGSRNKKDGRMDASSEGAGIEEQADIAKQFLTGLLDAFGLEGAVATRIEDDVLYIDVTGEQTEALVGSRGVIMQSVNELTRTVIQRRTHGAPRMRLDISGYNERRREALKIYAGRLAEQILDTGEEVALEPMHAADRKVVHDVIAEIEGVESFSEGEEPNRAVVISLADGQQPRNQGGAADEASEGGDDASEGGDEASEGGDEASEES